MRRGTPRFARWQVGALLLLLALGLLFAVQRWWPAGGQLDLPQEAAPALWRADMPDGARVWLFGAVHVLPPGIDWYRGTVAAAAGASDRLLLEIAEEEEDAAHAFARLAMRSPLAIEARLPPAAAGRWHREADRLDLDRAMLARMDSWAAALAVSRAATAGLGLSAGEGVEAVLRAEFSGRGRPIAALETSGGQLALFDRLPEAEQRAMLTLAIEDSPRAARDYRVLLKAWTTGDVAAIERVAAGGILTRKAVRAVLLVGRNAAWARRIEAEARPGAPLFVAVGAAHLPGEGGVLARLEAAGARVQRVQ